MHSTTLSLSEKDRMKINRNKVADTQQQEVSRTDFQQMFILKALFYGADLDCYSITLDPAGGLMKALNTANYGKQWKNLC